MRMSLAAVFVAIGIVIGYGARAIPLAAQSVLGAWLPFTAGESVRFSMIDFPEGSVTCKVTQVINGFVGCAGDDPQHRTDRWINLRFVKDITRRAER